jgi:hypothetical protein
MDMAGVYGNIGSRADYFVTLDKAIQRSKALLAKQAQYSVIENIDMQLDAMRRWSANDRSPTDEERKRVSIGLIAVRELVDTGDPAMDEYADWLAELNNYFEDWPTDKEAAEADADAFWNDHD